ncbi:MAG: hypothetical protein O7B26_08185, partial [Planctomycetota bacterium]|nr:hypothetical protein [Planctomycetota bacterium]
QVARVAGSRAFQSMTCLTGCGPSVRFCSVRWDKTVAWCSYTDARRGLRTIDHAGLIEALDGLGLAFCGKGDDANDRANDIDLLERDTAHTPCTVSRRIIVVDGISAAHSMDTEWFATDADNRVAILESGEEGVVPKAFLDERGHQYDFLEMLDLILEKGVDHRVEFHVDDIIEQGPGKIFLPNEYGEPWDVPLSERVITLEGLREKRRWQPQSRFGAILEKLGIFQPTDYLGFEAVCWLRDTSIFRHLDFKQFHWRRLPARNHVFVLLDDISTRKLVGMFEEGTVLSLLLDDIALRPERFGFYRYGHPEYCRDTYERLGTPINPVSVGQLPRKAQAVCKRAEFNLLTYASTTHLRPAEHVACASWEDGF